MITKNILQTTWAFKITNKSTKQNKTKNNYKNFIDFLSETINNLNQRKLEQYFWCASRGVGEAINLEIHIQREWFLNVVKIKTMKAERFLHQQTCTTITVKGVLQAKGKYYCRKFICTLKICICKLCLFTRVFPLRLPFRSHHSVNPP